MTGLELLEGLSFVDERYIAEAETAKLGRNVPWMKVLSVAACLCILITGVLAYGGMFRWGATEEAAPEAAPEAAAPQAAPEAALEAAPEAAPQWDSEIVPEEAVEEAPIPAGELQQIPFARLRIINVLDESFEAIVEEISSEPNPFEVGMQVTVVIDPDMVPGSGERTDVASNKTVVENQLIEIENGAYDAGNNTLYVEGMMPTD